VKKREKERKRERAREREKELVFILPVFFLKLK